VRVRPLLIALANARQYGNGALIAPEAKLDDGKLDVVVVDHRPPWRVLVQAPKLFRGTVAQVPGVSMTKASSVTISAENPVIFHVDGEPHVGGACVKASVHPLALRLLCNVADKSN
jgi:diacylglycerol kinase family enzyme